MGLEAATTIASLDKTWPLGGDTINKGDDHLRLIKSVLQAQFPGVGGSGFAIPITAKEAEINYLSGVSSNVQTQLNTNAAAIAANSSAIAGLLEAGTVMSFFQAAPPTGWTQVVTHNDAMLRVVNTAGGGNGGSSSPIALSHVHTTGDHTLIEAEIPAHVHDQDVLTMLDNSSAPSSGGSFNGSTGAGGKGGTTQSTGGGTAHNHGNTGSAAITPKYVDMILASKDA